MGALPSRTSLLRLLLGTAFVLLGFFLASSTSARADDLGLVRTTVDTVTDATAAPDSPIVPVTKIIDQPIKAVTDVNKPVEATVTKQLESVEPVVQPVAKLVQPVTKQVVQPVAKQVVQPVAKQVVQPVAKQVVQPVAKQVTKVVASTTSVVSQTTAAVTKTTAEVTKITTAVVRTVEPLVPVSVVVVEPVVDVVESVVPVADSAPVADLPILTADAGDPVDVDSQMDSVEVVNPAPAVVEQARAQRATAVELALLPRADSAPTAAVVPSVGTQGVAASAPNSSPDHPGLPERAPAVPSGAVLPGTGSTGSSAPAGGDVATTPATLVVPESRSGAVLSRSSHPHSGSTLDPGSRPD